MAPSKAVTRSSKKAKNVVTALVLPSNSNTLLFRKNVIAMMQSTPEGRDGDITVHASIERLSLDSGIQHSVQLCSSGGEQWITRWSGDRSLFPLMARASKRARDETGDDEEDAALGDVEPEVQEKRNRTRSPAAIMDNFATPAPSEGHSLRQQAASAPKAPIRRRQPAPIAPGSNSTADTFQQKAQRKVREAFSRGDRHGKAQATNEEMVADREKERLAVAEEERDVVDDLFSLCGRVQGLAVKSVVSESDYQCSNQPSTDLSSSTIRRAPSSKACSLSGRYVTA